MGTTGMRMRPPASSTLLRDREGVLDDLQRLRAELTGRVSACLYGG